MNLFDAIVSTTKEVFSGMLLMDVNPEAEIPPNITHQHSLSGIIGFAGRAEGMLAVHTPGEVAKAITGGFLGMEIDAVNEDVKDAIGELANMIAGSVKLAIVENGSEIRLSPPSVICGDSYTVKAPVETQGLCIPFVIPEGRFYVEFHVQERDA